MTAKSFIVKPLPFTILQASNTAAGYDPANMLNDYMGVVWKTTAGTSYNYIDIDLGADVPVDSVALLGLTGAKAGWLLRTHAATAAQGTSFGSITDDSGWVPLLAGSEALPSGRGVAIYQPAAPVTARYWRFYIDSQAESAAKTVARIVINKKIVPEREFVYGAAFGVRDLGTFDISPRGVPLWRRNKTKLRTTGISYGNLYKDEVEAAVLPLVEQVGNELPVFLCTDGTPDAQRQRRCYYGPLQGDLGTVWARANGFEWRVNMVSLI